jgi:hypothetical protein
MMQEVCQVCTTPHDFVPVTNRFVLGMGDMSSMMGGAGGDFGGIDFSKLGGGDAMDQDEDDDEDDDDEMPGLEGEEAEEESKVTSGETGTSATETASKIEEVN